MTPAYRHSKCARTRTTITPNRAPSTEPSKLTPALGTALDKKIDDFRNKKLFDFGFDEPTRIELHSGSQSWVFMRSGQDWSSDGKKVDASSVGSLISKLRDLTAVKFVTAGFTHPEIEATVTSNDGKRVEKVLISKSGKDSWPSATAKPLSINWIQPASTILRNWPARSSRSRVPASNCTVELAAHPVRTFRFSRL